jgi:hypothetical protein
MGTYFSLALGATARPGAKTRKKSKIRPMKTFSRIKLGATLAVLTAVLSVVYIIQVNSVSTKGYDIRALEVRLREVKESNKRLELEVTGLRSIQDLEQTVRQLNLVPSGSVKHLPESDYAFQE